MRQMSLFREDPEKYMEEYSAEFEGAFMEVMRRKGGMKVKANHVYQDVIRDRQHIHMNSTKWSTLTNFVTYLGKTGLCKVEQDAEGAWFLQYIDRDPRILARQEELQRRAETQRDEEEREMERLRKQVEDARRAEEEERRRRGESPVKEEKRPIELKERSEEEKVAFSLATPSLAANASSSASASALPASASSQLPPLPKPATPITLLSRSKPSLAGVFGATANAASSAPHSSALSSSSSSSSAASHSLSSGTKRKTHTMSTLEQLKAETERMKHQEQLQALKKMKTETPSSTSTTASSSSSSSSSRVDHWLFPNLIVKILNKKLLNGKLYKQKGVVLHVHDRYVGEVRLLNDPSSIIVRIDQEELETVLPAPGKVVRVVNGPYRGELASLVAIDEAEYSARIRLESGLLRGREVEKVEYEDICKIHDATAA